MAVVSFSVNFLVASVADCSISPIFLSEEKKSDGELESEKESETKLQNFYTEIHSNSVPVAASKDSRLISLKSCSIYESYYSKITTPPPQA